MVIDKQLHLQFLPMQQAIEHCTRGLSIWQWASNADSIEPDVVLACAGDVMTMETVAAAWWLRHHLPELKVRVVNVVDLMTLYSPDVHPHGIDDGTFTELFTAEKPVVFAFHGYQRAIHELIHGRPNAARFHVRGFNEQGTTTTPFGTHFERLNCPLMSLSHPQALSALGVPPAEQAITAATEQQPSGRTPGQSIHDRAFLSLARWH